MIIVTTKTGRRDPHLLSEEGFEAAQLTRCFADEAIACALDLLAGQKAFDATCKLGLEGTVSKRL